MLNLEVGQTARLTSWIGIAPSQEKKARLGRAANTPSPWSLATNTLARCANYHNSCLIMRISVRLKFYFTSFIVVLLMQISVCHFMSRRTIHLIPWPIPLPYYLTSYMIYDCYRQCINVASFLFYRTVFLRVLLWGSRRSASLSQHFSIQTSTLLAQYA